MTKIYVCNVKCLLDNEFFEEIYNRVSEKRKKKVGSYRFMKDKILALGADYLVNMVIKENYPNIKVPIEIIEGIHNKPYLKNNKDVFFNLSHSGEYVVCAIGNKEMGVDIEKIEEFDKVMTQRCFTLNENRQMRYIHNQFNNEYLFQMWTYKESYIKALGTGLFMDPLGFEIEVTSSDIKRVIQGNNQTEYYCKSYDVIPGYKISMCHADLLFPDNITLMELKRIIKEKL